MSKQNPLLVKLAELGTEKLAELINGTPGAGEKILARAGIEPVPGAPPILNWLPILITLGEAEVRQFLEQSPDVDSAIRDAHAAWAEASDAAHRLRDLPPN